MSHTLSDHYFLLHVLAIIFPLMLNSLFSVSIVYNLPVLKFSIWFLGFIQIFLLWKNTEHSGFLTA